MNLPQRSLFILAIAAVGCTEGAESPEGSRATLRDSAGTTIVENHEPVWGEGDAWSVAAEPELRIGAVESDDPDEMFTFVRGVSRLSDGRVVVIESETSEVRWFGADGTHLVTAGGRGDGPGEFNFASQLIRLPGDTVLVVDRPRVEHVFFSPEGDFVRQELLAYDRYVSLGPWRECASTTLPDRSQLGCLSDPSLPPGPEGSDPGPGHLRYFLRFARVPFDLERVDTLGVYGSLEQWGVSYQGRTAFARHPFHSNTVTAAGGDPLRIAIAVNPEYSIEVWTPDGTLERVIRRPGGTGTPGPDSEEMVRERFESYARDDPVLLRRFLDEIPTPELVPAVGAMVFGPDGELWVRWGAAPPDSGPLYDVFDREGRWLGQVEVPTGLQEVGDDYILGLRYDEFNVPYIEVFPLDRSG